MKRFISLSLLALLLSSCSGNVEESDSDLLNGILESQDSSEESVEEGDYETPVSEGPTILPPEDEEELTEEE
jgi:PBP1b-binding outer membrane lipoprotein LpoB